MKTILRSELDNENELTTKQVREFYVRSQVTALSDVEYIKDTSLDFCKKQNLKSAMVKSIGLLQTSSFDEILFEKVVGQPSCPGHIHPLSYPRKGAVLVAT